MKDTRSFMVALLGLLFIISMLKGCSGSNHTNPHTTLLHLRSDLQTAMWEKNQEEAELISLKIRALQVWHENNSPCIGCPGYFKKVKR